METRIQSYSIDEAHHLAFIASENPSQKKPAVLIVHDWSGRNHFADQKAKRIAELGYVGIAIDMYGEGRVGASIEEKQALMTPLTQDRSRLLKRLTAALVMAKEQPEVDSSRIAIIGFCFGGLCALDLARSGADIKGAISFHGLLTSNDLPKQPIQAKILVLHGHDDPMVPPSAVLAFEEEMTQAKADWQIHIFGNTMHAFANPEANNPSLGTIYSKSADERSFRLMRDFFTELFGNS